ncbi:MAG: hypothetical protein KA105_06890 [Caulobacter sp.]|nr:hypothetical protein [Caulobacter sp.]
MVRGEADIAPNREDGGRLVEGRPVSVPAPQQAADNLKSSNCAIFSTPDAARLTDLPSSCFQLKEARLVRHRLRPKQNGFCHCMGASADLITTLFSTETILFRVRISIVEMAGIALSKVSSAA